MKRLAGGVISESHLLNGTSMSQLSMVIIPWDMGNFPQLTEAKKGELSVLGVSDTAVRKAISKEELLKHCHWRTKGVEETTRAV